jgi:hypothetical protein
MNGWEVFDLSFLALIGLMLMGCVIGGFMAAVS